MAARAMPLRERFWFLPAVLCAGAVVLSQTLILLDARLGFDGADVRGLVYQVGVAGSRDLLGAVAGSVLTAAATTFSITVAVLALTSSSYGPRLVRNFMTDRGNQAVLGVFLATFLYALLVLRSVQDDDVISGAPAFVPHLAVNVAVVLAVVDIGVLVYFIHHISDSIQISTLSRRVREDLRRTIADLYPQAATDAADEDEGSERVTGDDVLPPGWQAASVVVPAPTGGYATTIDTARLVRLAEEHDVAIVLACSPGDHLVEGDPIARVWPVRGDDARDDDAPGLPGQLGDGTRSAVVIGTTRTPRQDVRFAVLQLVEIAVRALSPGTNDPFTATNALDDLSNSLALMARRRIPSPVRLGSDGRVRLIAPSVTMDEILTDVFAFVRGYALGAPSVLHRALALAHTVGVRTGSPRTRRLLDREIDVLMQAYTESGPPLADRGPLLEHAQQVRRRLLAG